MKGIEPREGDFEVDRNLGSFRCKKNYALTLNVIFPYTLSLIEARVSVVYGKKINKFRLLLITELCSCNITVT